MSLTIDAAYRQAISHFATGVAVITTKTEQGQSGMTASAVASLSLDPVLLLVCISTRLPTHDALDRTRRFGVNVLGEGQAELAKRFATPQRDKFSGLELDHECDVPVLRDAIAHFVCRVVERHPGGDHSIFVGEVEQCGCTENRRPLLYYQSSFGSLEDPHSDLRYVNDATAWSAV